MIIRRTKNSMYNIQKLRNIYNNAALSISSSKERISLLQRYLKKQTIKHLLLRVCTLFLYSYQKETIKLCKDLISEEKQRIENKVITFEHIGGPNTHTLDKLSSLFNQLRKMKVFYQLDGTFYSYDQIDLNDFEKHNFNFYKKDNKLYIEDDIHLYEFNSLFIGKYESNKKNNYVELFSSDNTTLQQKKVLYYSKSKKSGLKLKSETWLYLNQDGTKDQNVANNPVMYIYEFNFIKLKFVSKSFTKEYAFLGSDNEKMNLFYSLLKDYLSLLDDTYYEIINEKEFNNMPSKKILELFYENDDYSWVVFDILLQSEKENIIPVHDIYKKYHLEYEDLINIIKILRKYSLFEVSLSMDLIPRYKMSEIKEMYDLFVMSHKESLIKGDKNGQ